MFAGNSKLIPHARRIVCAVGPHAWKYFEILVPGFALDQFKCKIFIKHMYASSAPSLQTGAPFLTKTLPMYQTKPGGDLLKCVSIALVKILDGPIGSAIFGHRWRQIHSGAEWRSLLDFIRFLC